MRSDYLNFSEIKKIFHPFYLSLALASITGAFFLVSERFRLLLKTQNVHLSTWEAWKLSLTGLTFNFILPGGVGGDLVKAYYLKKERAHEAKSSPFTVIFDRSLGLYVMLLMALIAMVVNYDQVSTNQNLLVVVGVVGVGFTALNVLAIAAFNKRLRRLINDLTPKRLEGLHQTLVTFMSGFEHYGREKARVWLCLVLTAASQTLMVLTFYIAAQAAGNVDLSLKAYFFIVPVGLAVTGLPISPPGGIGVGQAAFHFLFNMYLGYKSSIGASVITIFQFLSATVGLWGAYFYVTRKKTVNS